MSDYSIVSADEAEDAYADSDVPGEFRALTEALEAEQGGGDADPGAAALRLRAGHRPSPRAPGGGSVELWAVSRRIENSDSTKVEDFWEASPQAKQTAE